MALNGGTLSINSDSYLGSYSQSGGTLISTNSAINLNALATWNYGVQSGITNVNDHLILTADANKILSGLVLNNNGTTTWLGNTNYYNHNDLNVTYYLGSTINNNGTWLDQAGDYGHAIAYDYNAQIAVISTFTNNGTYTKTGAAATTIGIAFNNSATGVVNINEGTLNLSSPFTNQGVITVASGATVAVQNSTFANQGTLQGNGTYQTLNTTIALINAGTLAPGIGDIGSLTVSGDYTQSATGIFDIQLSSLTSFDKLNVLGDMDLSGTLRINSFGGYNPNLNNTFTIATFDDGVADLNDLTGIFNNIVWSGFNPGVSFTASYFDHSIVINTTTTVIPDTSAPTITNFSPSNGATTVSIASNIDFTFSEAIQKGTGAITIHSGSAIGAVVESFDVATSNRLVFSDKSLIIDPVAILANNTQYFITFDFGSVKDLAGNNYASTSTYGDDILNALAGNDIVNGGLGADQMFGGLGNDTYYVDNIGDEVTETSALLTEIDTVNSTVTYTLGLNLENLTLIGAAVINGTGNVKANRLVGNVANNVLTGGSGADILVGGGGNDTYVVNITSTGILEDSITAGTGIDTIQVQGLCAGPVKTLTNAATIENLDISSTGSSLLNLTGNALANTLTGMPPIMCLTVVWVLIR